jgi:hypothetical protein
MPLLCVDSMPCSSGTIVESVEQPCPQPVGNVWCEIQADRMKTHSRNEFVANFSAGTRFAALNSINVRYFYRKLYHVFGYTEAVTPEKF